MTLLTLWLWRVVNRTRPPRLLPLRLALLLQVRLSQSLSHSRADATTALDHVGCQCGECVHSVRTLADDRSLRCVPRTRTTARYTTAAGLTSVIAGLAVSMDGRCAGAGPQSTAWQPPVCRPCPRRLTGRAVAGRACVIAAKEPRHVRIDRCIACR
jgi:hypothetical protein